MSFARYAWPDPQKTRSYPYKTIDGKVNPPLVDLGDTEAFSKTLRDAELLAMAYAYSGRIEFGKKAQEFLQILLLDKNNGLLPEIEYGQMIPGSLSKNPTGILEARGLARLFAIGNLLREYLKQVPEFNKNLETWKLSHFHWLKTSELGIKQQKVTNNLGSWYEAHFLGLVLSLNLSDDVKLGCKRLKERIRQQIQTDGSQTHELTRKDSLSYSAFNLTALYTGALYCKASGDDSWGTDSAEEALLSEAYAFFKDGVDNPDRWKYPQSKTVAFGEYEIPAIWEAARALDK